MAHTIVNAGFSRPVPGARRKKREWQNVTSIHVELPEAELGSKAFRELVQRHAPLGYGWVLEGYAIAKDQGSTT
jgi:hypothetical protein